MLMMEIPWPSAEDWSRHRPTQTVTLPSQLTGSCSPERFLDQAGICFRVDCSIEFASHRSQLSSFFLFIFKK